VVTNQFCQKVNGIGIEREETVIGEYLLNFLFGDLVKETFKIDVQQVLFTEVFDALVKMVRLSGSFVTERI